MTDSSPSASRSLEALLDKQAITELVHAYSRAVDRRDFELLSSLYATDGIDDHGALYCGPAPGYVEWLREALQGVDATAHHVHSVTIALDGDRAQGEVYLTAYNRLRAADGSLEDLVQGLRYLDRYRRELGAWRFERRTVVCDWAEHRPAFWDLAHPLLAGKRIGVGGAEDPSYRVLDDPTFARKS
jgi:hypothetical protein